MLHQPSDLQLFNCCLQETYLCMLPLQECLLLPQRHDYAQVTLDLYQLDQWWDKLGQSMPWGSAQGDNLAIQIRRCQTSAKDTCWMRARSASSARVFLEEA
jgi:hypothetical protein